MNFGSKNSKKSIFDQKNRFSTPKNDLKVGSGAGNHHIFDGKGVFVPGNIIPHRIRGRKYEKKSIFGQKTHFFDPLKWSGTILLVAIIAPIDLRQTPQHSYQTSKRN